MKIKVLIENTARNSDYHAEHGLSLFIESNGKKILFDTGETELFAENALTMGVDLREADFAMLSHGHHDHSGGIRRFLEINEKAPFYLNQYAFTNGWSDLRYIGIDQTLKGHARIVLVEDDLELEEGISIHACNDKERPYKTHTTGMWVVAEDGTKTPETFLHEQYLLLEEKGKRILISGCSHKGILNIVEWFKPDVLIGGFHFMGLDLEAEGPEELKAAAEKLLSYPTEYYTCHCTGLKQYGYLKALMGDRIHYISAGDLFEV